MILHPYHKDYQFLYIDTPAKLQQLCAHYNTLNLITFDTEFVRTQTLKPILGLIQVFDGNEVALIDPVAIDDLSPLSKILTNANIVKVAHSCSEDLEALWHHLGIIPNPVFDTQFAAGLLDIGLSIGYANLVEKLFEIKLDKGESRTDWIQRPLTQAQCVYASADVTHLLAIYENLAPQIESRQQSAWVLDEIAQLGYKKSQAIDADYAYLSLKNNWKLRYQQLAALKMLAKWRLEVAREEDKSLNFVLKEAAIFEVASKLPQHKQDLFACHNVYSKQARIYGDTLLQICQQAKSLEASQCPPKIERLIDFSGYKGCMAEIKETLDSLAEIHDIPAIVMASKKQVNQLLKWCWFELDECDLANIKPDLLKGWRGELISPYLKPDSSLRKHIEQSHEIKRSL